MRARTAVIGLASLLAMLAFAPVASADSAVKLRKPSPEWYTEALHERVLEAGPEGIRLYHEPIQLDCYGLAETGVSAGGCIIHPYGCTANFVFRDGSNNYIGTARHCVDEEPFGKSDIGAPMIMQVDPVTIAKVGEVVKHTGGEGDVGEDFALIKLDQDVVDTWGVNPAIPVIGGPQGVYEGCDTEAIEHFGHGYEVTVQQGYPRVGLATNWYSDGYGWTGHAFGGDSGSPVNVAGGAAAGNLTHLIVDPWEYVGSDTAGMRMTAILQFVGGNIQLVNADGTTSTSGAGCERQLATVFKGNKIEPSIDTGGDTGGDEGGNGGGNGGGKGGGKPDHAGGGNKGGGGNGNKKEKAALL